jgi:hypothetical protein
MALYLNSITEPSWDKKLYYTIFALTFSNRVSVAQVLARVHVPDVYPNELFTVPIKSILYIKAKHGADEICRYIPALPAAQCAPDIIVEIQQWVAVTPTASHQTCGLCDSPDLNRVTIGNGESCSNALIGNRWEMPMNWYKQRTSNGNMRYSWSERHRLSDRSVARSV